MAAGAAVAFLVGSAPAWADEPAAPMGGKEIASLRTATSRTFAAPDGARVTQVAAAPINVRDSSGEWVPIDTDLERSGSLLQSTAAPVTVQLPQTLDAGPIRVRRGADVASIAPQGAAQSQADVSGAEATYADALGGSDASYDVQPTGVKETITVDSRDARSHYTYALDFSAGLSARQLADGAIVLRHDDDSVAFTIPAPTVQEHGGALTSTHVEQSLSADGHTLSVDVDPNWLAQAELPVKIDPEFWSGADVNCDIANGASANTVNCQNSISVGADGSPAVAHRALLKFALPTGASAIPQDAIVLSAHLGMTQTALSGPGPVDIDAYSLTRSFTAQATWNSYNSTNAWTTAGGDYNTANKLDSTRATSATTGEGLSWVVSKVAQSWVDGSGTNNGLLLRAADESSPSKATFAGLNTTSSAPPLLNISWASRTGNSPGAKVISQSLSDHLSLGVNVATGNKLTQGSEINLPGVGQSLALGSTYNELQDGSSLGYGALGYASTLGFLDSRMYRMGYNGKEDLAWRAPDGTWFHFDRDPTRDQPGAAAWTMAEGLRAHVTTDRAGQDGGFPTKATITFDESQTKWYYDFGAESDATSGFGSSLQKIVDRNGNTLTLNYGSTDALHPTSVTDTNGRALTLNYTASQNYGGQKLLSSATDASNRQWRWSYTSHDLLSTYTDPDNNITHYYWDAGDKLNKIVTGGGRTTIIGYDPATNKTSSIRRVVNGSVAQPTGGFDPSTAWGNQDAVWQFNYTPSGGNTCPNPQAGNPPVIGRTVVTDPNGNLTTYCYDAKDRITQTFDALNRANSTNYDSFSNVTKASSLAGTANAATSTFTFDNTGSNPTQNPTGTTTPVDPTLDQSVAANTENTSARYDGPERYQPSRSTDEQGTNTYYGYDGVGNLTSVRDADTGAVNKATLHYNGRGQVDYSEDGKSQRTTYSYRTAAPWDLLTVTPPTVTPLALKPITFTYDSVSRVKTIADGRGTTKTLVYDGEDRVKSVTLTGANTGSFSFTYDADGNLTQRTDSANNTTTYTIDALNRRTAEAFPGSKSNTYTYDRLGNLASLTDATGQVTSYTYDPVNRVKTISSPKRTNDNTTDTITYTYTDRSGTSSPDTVQVAYPGGAKKTVKYDLAGKATSIVATNASNVTLINLGLTYISGSGNSQRQTTKVITRTLDSQTTTYGYSGDVGRLTTANTPGATSYAYGFDPAGNRTGKTTYTASGSVADVVAFTYNADNELCRTIHSPYPVADCATTPSGATSYTYDANGNRTGAGSNTFGFDGFDRLTTGGLGYLSPGNGELTASTGTTYQNSQLGLIRQTAGTATTALVRDPSGQVVAQRSASDKQFYITDQLGSTLALVSDSGAQVRSLRYDPDGTATSNTGTGPAPVITWAQGQTVNGQYHFGARYYDPNTAAWTQQDPLNQVADFQQGNRYAYAAGDPVNTVDLSGLSGTQTSCSAGPAGVSRGSNTGDFGKYGHSASFGLGLGAGCATTHYTGESGNGVSVGAEGCALVCVGVNSDTGFSFGFGPKIDLGVDFDLDF